MSTPKHSSFLGGSLFFCAFDYFDHDTLLYDFNKDDDGAQKQRKVVLPSGELPEPGEEEEEFLGRFYFLFFPLDRILLGETLMIARLHTRMMRCELDGADSLSLNAILLSFLSLSLSLVSLSRRKGLTFIKNAFLVLPTRIRITTTTRHRIWR